MVDAAVRLRRVRVGELPEFARHALLDRARHAILPITVQRADAQSQNPAASPDDVGLIVAYLEDRCIGYLGMFPVWLDEDGGRRKVLSLSTYFVGPEYRGTGAGGLLLLHALSLGHDLFVAGFSEVAGRVFQGVGFRPVSPMSLLNLRIDAALILPLLLNRSRDRVGSRGLAFVTRTFDAVGSLSRRTVEAALRPLVIRLLLRPLRASCGELFFRAVESVRSPQGLCHDERFRGDSHFVRDDAMVNWMVHHPWITEDQSIRLDYAFSYRRKLFRFLPFELRLTAGAQEVGYVVLRISADDARTVLKILDCTLIDERHRQGILGLALREALRWSADHIECGEEFGPLLRSSFLYRVLTRRTQRGCLLLTRDRGGFSPKRQHALRVGICDGDAPFV